MSWTLTSESEGYFWTAFDHAIKLFGKSEWKMVNFSILEKDFVPPTAGIYMICSGVPTNIRRESNNLLNNLMTPHYIGRSGSLKKRFKDHCESKERNINDIKKIYSGYNLRFYFMEAMRSKIDILESLAWKCFRTGANTKEIDITEANKLLVRDILYKSIKKGEINEKTK